MIPQHNQLYTVNFKQSCCLRNCSCLMPSCFFLFFLFFLCLVACFLFFSFFFLPPEFQTHFPLLYIWSVWLPPIHKDSQCLQRSCLLTPISTPFFCQTGDHPLPQVARRERSQREWWSFGGADVMVSTNLAHSWGFPIYYWEARIIIHVAFT